MKDGELFSVVLHLQVLDRPAPSRVPTASALGYQAYAAFLDMLRQADPALSQRLHETRQRKPFTLSGLLEQERLTRAPLRPGQPYQLRLTCLESGIFEALLEKIVFQDGSRFRLKIAGTEFALTRLAASQGGGWSGRSSFTELAALPPEYNWDFEFASPTAFSLGEQAWGGRKFVVLPDPGLVFDNLAASWNGLAPPELERIDAAGLRAYVEQYVVITRHAIQSEFLPLKQHPQIGFTGAVSFRLMDRSFPEQAALLNRLAAFAFYAGVGYKTAMGMGQVRLSAAKNSGQAASTIPAGAGRV